ncbi:MAG: methyltransferase domain-containing protein [Pseudanabaenaceae cyanobacterium bins.68]|nr:methyltransferase domain-containing protein [Pseudanabaenaceae cyanobacterium bins.68]
MNLPHDQWQPQIEAVRLRYDREYRNDPLNLPPEVEQMPIYQDWRNRQLVNALTSPFWELGKFTKNLHCLDIGCGVSFLIYPWRDWQMFFYGQEISLVARDGLNSRAPQLNSKLFKGVKLGAAHQLNYDQGMFERVIATGFSCYYSLDYWRLVLTEAKRVLKPGGLLIFDAIAPASALAENWAILEMYLGTEIFLESQSDWQALLKSVGAKVLTYRQGELFDLYQVMFN